MPDIPAGIDFEAIELVGNIARQDIESQQRCCREYCRRAPGEIEHFLGRLSVRPCTLAARACRDYRSIEQFIGSKQGGAGCSVFRVSPMKWFAKQCGDALF